jgi:uncharacterized membrane protein YkvA (DUF1232 family)
MDPRKLKRWLILVAVLYLVFPRDLIPDFFGRGLGLIDDLLLVAFLIYFYRRRLRDHTDRASRESREGDSQEGSSRPQPARSAGAPDPYEVLGIPSSASADAIRVAYKARMQEYHPDKVAHLGEELQQLAHRKALEIQQAYRQLRRPPDAERRRS